MSLDPTEPDYLNAIFAALRTLSRELAAMKGWLRHAESAGRSPWSLQFLAAARASHERASACLESTERRLRDLGPPDEVPAPLDKLPASVASIRADLREEKEHLLRLESEAASRPIGRA